MARDTLCLSCLRLIRQQAKSRPLHLETNRFARGPNQSLYYQRPFSTTTSRLVDGSPEKSPPPPPSPLPPNEQKNDPLVNIANTLRTNLRSTTEPYIAFGGTEDLFRECNRQCSYTVPSTLATPPTPAPKSEAGEDIGEGTGWWVEPKSKGGLGLEATFNTWAQVIFLHMWLLTVRLRCFPEKYVKDWHQNLLDHCFYAAEDRMATWHGMSARGVRNKHLKDLWAQWRGVLLSYDEGLIKGDAVMATAVWRNVFKADPNVDVADLAVVTAYMMRELQMLGRLDDTKITEGRVEFGDPKTVAKQSLDKKSSAMNRKPTVEEIAAGQSKEVGT